MGGVEPTYSETTTRFAVLKLVVEVRRDGVYLRLNPLQSAFRQIGFDEISDSEIATYSARTYGGWHWGMRKTVGGNAVYRVRGNHGVELRLTDGRKIFIGSQRPDDLHAAIAQGR